MLAISTGNDRFHNTRISATKLFGKITCSRWMRQSLNVLHLQENILSRFGFVIFVANFYVHFICDVPKFTHRLSYLYIYLVFTPRIHYNILIHLNKYKQHELTCSLLSIKQSFVPRTLSIWWRVTVRWLWPVIQLISIKAVTSISLVT